MIDEKELHRLFKSASARGAAITASYDREGRVVSVRVLGAAGIGPHPMSPIGAAERLREYIAAE